MPFAAVRQILTRGGLRAKNVLHIVIESQVVVVTALTAKLFDFVMRIESHRREVVGVKRNKMHFKFFSLAFTFDWRSNKETFLVI